MGFSNGFSATILLDAALSKDDKKICIDLLMKNDFSGYNYESETYLPFDVVLKNYPERPRYLAKYHNLDFVISCAEGRKYMRLLIDRVKDDSRIIVEITSQLCKSLNTIDFMYVDNEGGSPDNIEKVISKTEIKWLFKYNYFGKAFIEKFGSGFFTAFPCEKGGFITSDVFRLDLVTDIFNPISKELMVRVEEHLAKFDVKARFYDYKNHRF